MIQHMLVTTTMVTSKHEEDGSNGFVMVSTVIKNYKGLMKHKIKMTQEARRLQWMIGNPTEIANCPITVHDIKNANQIFGSNLASKMTRT